MRNSANRAKPEPQGRKRATATSMATATAISLMAGYVLVTPTGAADASSTPTAPAASKVATCLARDVRLTISTPLRSQSRGAPVRFAVHITNLSPQACTVTPLQRSSGLATELLYVRIYNAAGTEVRIPSPVPILAPRSLAQVLAPHGEFSSVSVWDGWMWSPTGNGPAARLRGLAPAGQYTAYAQLASPTMRSQPAHFRLLGTS